HRGAALGGRAGGRAPHSPSTHRLSRRGSSCPPHGPRGAPSGDRAPPLMSALDIAVVASAVAASVLAGVRWLRVAQREHYLAGSVIRFAARWWWGSVSFNRLLIVLARSEEHTSELQSP